MPKSQRRSIRGLVASWAVYWTGLAVVKLGPMAAAIWRATHTARPNTGNVSASFSNFLLSMTVSIDSKHVYSGSVHLLALAAWIAGPPLAAWALWIIARPSANRPDESRALGAPSSDPNQLMSGYSDGIYRKAPDSAKETVSEVTKRS